MEKKLSVDGNLLSSTTLKTFVAASTFLLTLLASVFPVNNSSAQCTCTGNLVLNPSFESGTTSWTWSGGNFNAGTGAVKCGSKSGDFEITNTSSNSVYQVVGTDLAVGTVVNASVWAGTHDNSYSHKVFIHFYNASNVYMSTGSVEVEVDKVLANSPTGPQLYTMSATVPTGAKYTRVGFKGTGNWIKTDMWCVTTTPPAGTGSIGDRVWLDADGDGIQDASETGGLTGITVQLKNSGGTVIATTSTNASGNYLFSGLAAGTYRVAFPPSISGAIVTLKDVGGDDNIDSDADQTTGETANIVLGAGQNITNVDAGYCPTTLSLGNRVWNDANSNGINDGETGIAGVTLYLYKDDNNDNVPDGASIASTTTDADGYYMFVNLGPGNYIVGVVTPAGFASSPVNGGDPDNDINLDDNGQVTVGNETRGLAITLIAGTEPTGSGNENITYDFGFVSTACSCPNNIVLNNSFENGTTSWNWTGGNFNAGTGAVKCGIKSGDFEITNASNNRVWQNIGTNLAPGTIINASVWSGTHDNSFYHQVAIEFLDAGNNLIASSAVEVNKVLAAAPAGPQYYAWSAVVPNGAVTTRVSFSGNGNWVKTDQWCVTLTPVGSIADRVWNDTDKDGIQDVGELGLAGITVSLYDNSNNLIASTVTDAFGLYKFSGLPVSAAGINYQVQFSLAPGYIFSPQNADAAGVTGANNSDANTTTGRTGNVTLTTATPNVTYVDAGMYISQPSRIGDFIWNDLDKDGVQDAGEPGIAGVVVTLYDNSGNPVRTTITDNNGHYEFNDVPAGTYTLGITPPPGYQASPKDATGDAADSDFNPATFRTDPFVVSAGVDITRDGGLNVTDPAKASVGDFVWADLDNDNVQDANEPGIPGVTVELYTSANVLVASTTTNALGYYVFNNVDPGNYYVKFSNTPAGYALVTADSGGDDFKDSDVTGANGAGTTATFSLAADQNNMTIDAGLRRTTALNSLGDFVWYDLDKDGIQDAGEAGVPGITVTLYNATTGAVVKTTTTNASGLYMFFDVAAGSYTVGFSNLPAGYAFSPADATGDAADSDPNPNTGRTGTITIAGTGNVITTVDAGIVSNPNVFDSKSSIGDFVWNDLNNNGIQDAGEPGIPGVTVTLYAADGTTVIGTTTTDALGKYQFSNLPAGTYIVGFSGFPAGYSLSSLPNAGADDAKDSDADPGTGKTGPITLLSGQVNTTVDAALRNPAVLARVGNFVWNDVNGNGHQDAGEPGVPGVSVYLLDNLGNVLKNTVSDANGFYLFTDLAAGTYSIRFGNLPAGFVATAKDAAPANDNTDSDANTASLTTDPFALAAGGIDLTRDFGVISTTTASVGDYVWSDVDGDGQQDANEPGIAGVLVTLYNSAGVAVASTVTDANGKYLFVNVPPGSYTMGFSGLPLGSSFTTKDNGADASDSDVNPGTGRTDAFTLVAGQSNTTIDAGLVTRYAAVGDYVWKDQNSNGIQDTGEPPVAGVTVILYNSANQPIASAVTDGNGYYFINNIPVPAGGASYTIGFSDVPTGMIFTTKNASGSTIDNDSNPNTGTGITDAFVLNPGQIRPDIDAGLIQLVNISGNVWHDVDAMNDNLVDNVPAGSSIPVGLRVYLVNTTTGLVERVTLVNSSTGTFAFSNVMPNTTYRLYLTSVVLPLGTPESSIPSILPSGWEHTGQKNANPPNPPTGSDGINDGRITVPVGSSDVININFGIRLGGGDTVIG
jgi:protocatechuate 3,4-dioxygenase beta subunit